MIRPSAPLGVVRSTRATTRSPCSASFMFAGGDVDVVRTVRALARAPRTRSPAGVAGQAAHHEVHPRCGRPTRPPRIFTTSPLRDQCRRTVLQLPPGLGVEVEPVRRSRAPADGLAVIGQELEYVFDRRRSHSLYILEEKRASRRRHETGRRRGVDSGARCGVRRGRRSAADVLVPEVGLEPTLAEANTALNRARLPIPPLRRWERRRGHDVNSGMSRGQLDPSADTGDTRVWAYVTDKERLTGP